MRAILTPTPCQDDPGAGFAVGKLLSDLGYEVTTADSGQAARDQPSAAAFDVLLCDHGLPDTSGVELLAVLGQRWPEAATILMSGSTDDDLSHGRVAAGALRFLSKPFSAGDLHREVQAALAARKA